MVCNTLEAFYTAVSGASLSVAHHNRVVGGHNSSSAIPPPLPCLHHR